MCGLEVSLLCLVDFCFSPQRDEFHVLSIFLTYFLSSLKIPVRGAIYNAATTSCKTLSKSRRLQLHCLTLAIRIFKFNASRFRHHLFCFCEDGTELTSTEPSRLSVNLLFIINNQEEGGIKPRFAVVSTLTLRKHFTTSERMRVKLKFMEKSSRRKQHEIH